jgi:hypothetical protein
MKILLLILLLLIGGCVSVPIPPSGDNAGKYGHIKLSVKIQYLPATEPEIDWFNPIIPQPKLLKDK